MEAKPMQKRRGRKKGIAMPPKIPVPVRGLWQAASEEEKQRAHKTASLILQYWMGHRTKKDIADELKIPPLRIWQLSGQAVAGMTAGLLKQPRTKKGDQVSVNKEDDPKYLKRKIADLEQTIYSLRQLIDILKEMPGCKDVTIPLDDPKLAAAEKRLIENEKRGIKTGLEIEDRPKARRGRPKKNKSS